MSDEEFDKLTQALETMIEIAFKNIDDDLDKLQKRRWVIAEMLIGSAFDIAGESAVIGALAGVNENE
jgi:hypothetical protein